MLEQERLDLNSTPDEQNPSAALDVLAALKQQTDKTRQRLGKTGEQLAAFVDRLKPEGSLEENKRPPEEEILQPSVDENLGRALAQGPSSLLDEAITQRLAALSQTAAGKIPFSAFLRNPDAALEVLRAEAKQVKAYAAVRTTLAELTRWMADVAASDARRDTLLNYVGQLEKDLGDHIDSFCQKNNLPVPVEGSLERAALLLRINVEFASLQTRAEAIRTAGEKLVGRQVKIQAETAEQQMIGRELPGLTDASKEANVAKEAALAEQLRHWASIFGMSVSGTVVGAIGGLYTGLEKTVSVLVEKYPEVAIPLGAGAGMFVLQLVAYSGPLSGEILKAFALKGGLVSGMAAIGVGIGLGLARWASRGDSQTPEANVQQ